METHSDWTDLLPSFSGFEGFLPENTMEAPAPQLTIPTTSSSRPAPPVFRVSSSESSTAPPEIGYNSTFLVSTGFPPVSTNSIHPPDLILLSLDSVFFHVHRSVLQAASEHAFHISYSSLPPPSSGPAQSVITIPESSMTLNIILHTIYGLSCAHYLPSCDAISIAVAALAANDISVNSFMTPSTPLGALLLVHAPLHPLDAYTLAAKYDLYDLAVLVSTHLLSLNLSCITDEIAEQMGSQYLKRLFLLHYERVEGLKRIIMPPPHPHPPTPTCTSTDQGQVASAWTLAMAYLIWTSRVDLTTITIKSIIGPIENQIQCPVCRNALKTRMQTLVMQWNTIRRTI
ncbi:hypothetical protein BV22DRAFT_1126554 [Leucogyrophana mollusca]|uniref:Uncharacterized protein n=1 Tax=Leucogyrophana mollusca TaxID=85980 RepID=A0ACB8BTC5_9AGAM|nr:hypothetical protein BV22DRAFT_1126554 [Leucogyrophana mollusca]